MPGSIFTEWTHRPLLQTRTRGKCRYGDRHESVTLHYEGWWGESTHEYECPYAPEDQCSACAGRGELDLTPDELEVAQFDGARTKKCVPCGGNGYVPGPHWPYRWPQPPPLNVRY